jgi:pimeloyl-ACP methyl ester carboxylesterase
VNHRQDAHVTRVSSKKMSCARCLIATAFLGLAAVCLPAAASPLWSETAAIGACSSGAVAAVIGGKRTCLKTGRPCKAKLDRQYRRYGFRCYRGRLIRLSSGNVLPLVVRRIDVGGYRLAIRCQGKGSPTVVLESGFDTGGNAWFLVQPKAARTTRVCSYDRAGVGASDPRRPPGPPPASRIAEELHTLLHRAGLAAPYVFAGHSFGAFFARLYIKRYPDEVAGLVTVDGTPLGLDPAPPDLDLVQGRREAYYIAAANDEVAAAPTLGSRPLIVLTRGRAELSPELESSWLQSQTRVSHLSNDSLLVRVDNAGHGIQEENPGIVAEALRQTVITVRKEGRLPACADTKLPRLAGTCLGPSTRGNVEGHS